VSDPGFPSTPCRGQSAYLTLPVAPAVPVRLIASFKRMKTLSKDLKVIVAALETSPELLVSGHRVRRKLPLPDVDETEVLLRTAIVDNLPEQATIGAVHPSCHSAASAHVLCLC